MILFHICLFFTLITHGIKAGTYLTHLLLLSQHLNNSDPSTPASVQKSLIRLIPKPAYKAEHPSPNDIRPISLRNSLIRIINHHITQRLIKILSSRISPLQQAFMPGRNIYRNIFTARIMTQQLVSQKPPENYTPTESSELHHITLLDIAKAFDTITTFYIHQVLQKMDFPATFINYILDHIGNNYGQLLNGNQIYHPPIAIQNGVRQGLPISPILFNLCLEPLIAKLSTNLTGMFISMLRVANPNNIIFPIK